MPAERTRPGAPAGSPAILDGPAPGAADVPEDEPSLPEGTPSSSQPGSDGRIGRRAALSTLSLVGAQIVTMPIAFIAIKVITNGVGPVDYGIYATAFSFTAIFSLLADFGVNAVTAREVAKHPERADEIVPFSVGLRLALSLLVAPLIVLGSFAAYPGAAGVLHLGVALVAAAFLPDAIRTVLYGYLTARGRNHWVAVAGVIQQGLFLACTATSVALSLGLVAIFGGYLLASVLTTVVVAFAMRGSVRMRPKASLRAWRHLFVMSASIGTIQIVNLLYLRVDGLMLGLLVGPSAVGLYTIAYSVINGASVIPGFLMSSLLPNIVSLDDRGRESLLTRALAVLAVLGSLLVALLVLAAPVIVEIISSPEFAAASAPLTILGIAAFFTFVNPAFGYSSAALNVHQQLVWISIGGLGLNVVLNLALIPRIGVVGAASSTLACEALGFVATYISFTRRTGLRVRLAGPLLRSLSIVGLALLVDRLAEPIHIGLEPVAVFFLVSAEVLGAGAAVIGVELAGRRLRRRSSRSPRGAAADVATVPRPRR